MLGCCCCCWCYLLCFELCSVNQWFKTIFKLKLISRVGNNSLTVYNRRRRFIHFKLIKRKKKKNTKNRVKQKERKETRKPKTLLKHTQIDHCWRFQLLFWCRLFYAWAYVLAIVPLDLALCLSHPQFKHHQNRIMSNLQGNGKYNCTMWVFVKEKKMLVAKAFIRPQTIEQTCSRMHKNVCPCSIFIMKCDLFRNSVIGWWLFLCKMRKLYSIVANCFFWLNLLHFMRVTNYYFFSLLFINSTLSPKYKRRKQKINFNKRIFMYTATANTLLPQQKPHKNNNNQWHSFVNLTKFIQSSHYH